MPRDSSGNVSLSRNRAVTGQKVLAEQVNVPFDDVQSIFNSVAWRDGLSPMTGNLNMNGFSITGLNEASNPSDVVLYSQLLSFYRASAPVGMKGEFARTSAPLGWIPAITGTIGNVGSGATISANSDTVDLYTLWWGQFSDAVLPIQTNTGAASTRGSSAASDFAAGKRLSVFDMSGLFTRGNGAFGGSVGEFQENMVQAHQHTGQTSTNGAHQHSARAALQDQFTGSVSGSGNGGTFLTDVAGDHSHTFTTEFSGGIETRPKNRSLLICWKL